MEHRLDLARSQGILLVGLQQAVQIQDLCSGTCQQLAGLSAGHRELLPRPSISRIRERKTLWIFS